MGVYTNWNNWFIRICNNMSMWVTIGIMEFHECSWEFVRVFGSLWEYMEAYGSLDKYVGLSMCDI